MSEMSRENIGQLSATPMHVLDFRHVAPFQNQSASKATGLENRGQIADFSNIFKISGAVSEMS